MVLFMSEKELLYLEDALQHEQFLKTQCTEIASKLTDPDLKNFVSGLAASHQEVFKTLYNAL